MSANIWSTDTVYINWLIENSILSENLPKYPLVSRLVHWDTPEPVDIFETLDFVNLDNSKCYLFELELFRRMWKE